MDARDKPPSVWELLPTTADATADVYFLLLLSVCLIHNVGFLSPARSVYGRLDNEKRGDYRIKEDGRGKNSLVYKLPRRWIGDETYFEGIQNNI